ncbi:hypothetical protein CEP51_006637 [Fusarium floridanum]|uniref:Uncharacterized protein n=1 Tax=Fusarium floridanum TaxID=1325733 RepID=A0A428RS25_9HYPO|nr:hypothetical protein CEP51_006637 [Fusarium floridanum]
MSGTESAASNPGGFDLLRRATQAMMSSVLFRLVPVAPRSSTPPAMEPTMETLPLKPCARSSINPTPGQRPEHLQSAGLSPYSCPALQALYEVQALEVAGCRALADLRLGHGVLRIVRQWTTRALEFLTGPVGGTLGQHNKPRSLDKKARAGGFDARTQNPIKALSNPQLRHRSGTKQSPSSRSHWVPKPDLAPAPKNGPGGIPTCKRQLLCFWLCRKA